MALSDGADSSTASISTCDPPLLSFSSPSGMRVSRAILFGILGFDPHDYQLEGVCKLLDGIHVLALIPTGGGKTGFIFMAILLLRAAREDPRFHIDTRKKLPKNAAAVVVLPTNSVEMEMAKVFVETYKISSVVINAEQKQKAQREGRDLWTLAQSEVEAIFLSPEQLHGASFEALLRDETFWARAWLLVDDEIHFLDSWGPSFRPAFLQIGNVFARMPERTRLLGMTATLLAGAPASRVLRFLGFRDGTYHTIHRSNLRPNIRIAFRPLSTSMNSLKFPDLKWVLDTDRKTIIFVKTINLAFRTWAYLWTEAGGTLAEKLIRFRRYSTLEDEEYNAETRRLMHDDPKCQIVIATERLSVGVDFRAVWYCLILDDTLTADRWNQDIGRIGRDMRAVPEAFGIWYHTKNAVSTAQSIVAAGPPTRKPETQPKMEYAMAKLLLAPCKRVAQNELYANPEDDPPCTCRSCAEQSASSDVARSAALSSPTHAEASAQHTPSSGQASNPSPCSCCGLPPDHPACSLPQAVGKAKRSRKAKAALTELQISELCSRFVTLREQLYEEACDEDTFDTPPIAFLPPHVIDSIARQYHMIKAASDLQAHIAKIPYIANKADLLYQVLVDAKPHLVAVRADAAAAKRSKGSATVDPVLEDLRTSSSKADGSATQRAGTSAVSSDDLAGEPTLASSSTPPCTPPECAQHSASPLDTPLDSLQHTNTRKAKPRPRPRPVNRATRPRAGSPSQVTTADASRTHSQTAQPLTPSKRNRAQSVLEMTPSKRMNRGDTITAHATLDTENEPPISVLNASPSRSKISTPLLPPATPGRRRSKRLRDGPAA